MEPSIIFETNDRRNKGGYFKMHEMKFFTSAVNLSNFQAVWELYR